MRITPLSEQVDQLIKSSGAARTETAVCTTWILVTEWVDDHGDVWLEENRTTDLPAWRRNGILNYILSEFEQPWDEEEEDG
jgi:hypothetical protein